VTVPTQWWRAPTHAKPLDGTVSLPGSKSMTNRVLVLAAPPPDHQRCSGRFTPVTPI